MITTCPAVLTAIEHDEITKRVRFRFLVRIDFPDGIGFREVGPITVDKPYNSQRLGNYLRIICRAVGVPFAKDVKTGDLLSKPLWVGFDEKTNRILGVFPASASLSRRDPWRKPASL